MRSWSRHADRRRLKTMTKTTHRSHLQCWRTWPNRARQVLFACSQSPEGRPYKKYTPAWRLSSICSDLLAYQSASKLIRLLKLYYASDRKHYVYPPLYVATSPLPRKRRRLHRYTVSLHCRTRNEKRDHHLRARARFSCPEAPLRAAPQDTACSCPLRWAWRASLPLPACLPRRAHNTHTHPGLESNSRSIGDDRAGSQRSLELFRVVVYEKVERERERERQKETWRHGWIRVAGGGWKRGGWRSHRAWNKRKRERAPSIETKR